MLSENMNGYVPRGNYRSVERILFDLNISPTRNFGELSGDGAYENILFSSATDANAIHFTIRKVLKDQTVSVVKLAE